MRAPARFVVRWTDSEGKPRERLVPSFDDVTWELMRLKICEGIEATYERVAPPLDSKSRAAGEREA